MVADPEEVLPAEVVILPLAEPETEAEVEADWLAEPEAD